MKQDLEATYDELTYVSNNNEWQKHIYLTNELEKPADFLDCSFICRNVEKPNGCDLFLMEVKMIIFFPFLKSCDLFLMEEGNILNVLPLKVLLKISVII